MTFNSTADTEKSILQSNSVTVIIAIGVSTAILLILSTTLIIIVVVLICNYKRRSAKQKLYTDSSYSTLNRGTGQQIQPPSIQNDSADLYNQIQLSPSTGQTEFIQTCAENENINNPTYNHRTHSNTEHSVSPSVAPQADSQLAPQNIDESTSEQPTYAAVDKSKKKKLKKQRKKDDPKHNTAENKGPPISPYTQKVLSTSADKEVYAAGKDDPNNSQKMLKNTHTSVDQDQMREQEINPTCTVEELYTAVKKKPKGSVAKDDEETPPIPPHTVEELYTAVQKKPADENKEDAPPEEMCIAKEKAAPVLQHTIEDLYTAVLKMPKYNSSDDIETAPPLPPHTVEELYTAVQKKPKGSAMEDEEEAPPIPPHTLEDTY